MRLNYLLFIKKEIVKNCDLLVYTNTNRVPRNEVINIINVHYSNNYCPLIKTNMSAS